MSIPAIEQCRSQLKPEYADTIRATLPLVGSNIDKITRHFYKSMFEAHPELINNMFNRGNQRQGAQQRALAASVATFATVLVNPEADMPDRLLARIGHKHVSLGVTREQYQIVHDYLFGAIVAILGADVVTPPVAAAWEDVFWIMANLLIDFEAGLYTNAGVKPGDVFVNTRVLDRKELGGGVVEFVVESKDASKPLPVHQPGQYISVGAKLPDGARQLRQYSLVDAGIKPGQLTFAVKALEATGQAPAGEVSNWLIQNVKEGGDLEITLPFGDLVLDQSSNCPVVLISAGIGVTPMLGILSHLAGTNSSRATLSLHADKSSATDVFFEERIQLISRLSSGEAKTWHAEDESGSDVLKGRLDLSAIQLPSEAQYYLCGGNEFLQSMRKQLQELNVPADRVNFELFSPNDWLLDV